VGNGKALTLENQSDIVVYMDTETDYYLLLVDIRDSSKLSEKGKERARELVENLPSEIERISSGLSPKPELGLTMSYGDEIAGLLRSPVQLFDVVTSLQAFLYPHIRFRFAAVKGRVAVVSTDIRRVGGEVFKKASEAMDRAKRRNEFSAWLLGKGIFDSVLDSLTEMSSVLVEDMTEYQYEVFKLLEAGFSQKDIAKKLGKHPQSVSDAARRGAALQILGAYETIRSVLNELDQ
jgi:hypothetical protein